MVGEEVPHDYAVDLGREVVDRGHCRFPVEKAVVMESKMMIWRRVQQMSPRTASQLWPYATGRSGTDNRVNQSPTFCEHVR